MAQFAEADDINNDIFLELHTVVNGQLRHEDHRFWVIAVDVKNWCFNHFDDIRAIQGRPGVTGIGRREANLIVDHNVNGSTNAVATGHGQIEGFHDYALTGKGCVPMNKHRQDLGSPLVIPTIETSTHRAGHHRVHDLEVGGIKRQ